MVLRKCPSCRETVGAESTICPRCGVDFKVAAAKRVIRWVVIILLIVWIAAHFLLRRS
jgi:uncharacterized paraquat-inducible protein A